MGAPVAEKKVYFGSVAPTRANPFKDVNNTFDVKTAHWNDEGTRIIDNDGEWIAPEFLEQMAANPEMPTAALALVLANLRREGTIDKDKNFDPDVKNFDAEEMKAIIKGIVEIGVNNGILHGDVEAGGEKSWIRAMAEALGLHADDLAKEMADMSFAVGGNAEGGADPDKLAMLNGKMQEFQMFMGVVKTAVDAALSEKDIVQ